MTKSTFRIYLPAPDPDLTLHQILTAATAQLTVEAATAKVRITGTPQVTVTIAGVHNTGLVCEALCEPIEDRRRRVATHGTDAGYYAHRRRWKTEPCGPCRAAHADVERARVAADRDDIAS